MASVAIENVVKNYGAVRVMNGLSLDILEGEFLVLVGPSGCGKSTLLRMIAGLEEITAGEISIADLVVNDIEPKERNIAMVFQNYALYPHMSVAQNMGFSLKLSRLPKDQIRKKVESAASILGLEPLLERHPGQLSGGQRQRVAMGRAIVRDPAVFLFDEPLSNLDAKLRVQMRTEIKALHQRLKTTMVYVTHDQVEAMTMADRIVVMHDGIIEQIGTPLDLYDRPDNLFVAGFIGSPAMNLIEGQIRDGRFVGENGIHTDAPAGSFDGERVVCGIRPDQLSLVDGDVAEIGVIEPTGAETQIVLHTGSDQITCLLRERLTLSPGDKTGIQVNAGQAHFFDAETGQRIN